MSGPVLLALVALNLASFLLFGYDKRQARRNGQRVSERALLLSALVSGTIGAWLGMAVFRHKTRKRSFQAKMVAVTAVDVAVALAALLLTR